MTSSSIEFNTKAKIVFTVNEFSKIKRNEEFKSNVFAVGSNQWLISLKNSLTLSRNKNLFEDYLTIGWFLIKSYQKVVKTNIEVYIKGIQNDNKYIQTNGVYVFEEGFKSNYKLLIPKNVIIVHKEEYLPNDRLTIGFNFQLSDDFKLNNYRFFNFEKIMNNKDLSDFMIIIGKKHFFVHKIILSSRSPVFESMFCNEMKEKYENKAIIEDIDSEVFEEFLNYLYLGKLDKIESMVDRLLYVSDKYEVTELKDICEQIITFEIGVDNAINTLIIADNYNCYQLKTRAMKCIALNLPEIRSKFRNEWLEFIKNNNLLVDEIIEFIDENKVMEIDSCFRFFSYNLS